MSAGLHPPIGIDLSRRIAGAIQKMTADEKRNVLRLLNEPATEEKRHRCRKNQRIKTRLELESRAGSGIIENLSPNGAFLITRHASSPGSEISLSFSILNFEFPVRLKAEVVWIDPRGMGVRFKPSLSLDCRLAEQKLADAMRPIHPESYLPVRD